MIRVFLVDDHEVVRRGIADLINMEADLEVVGEASTARQALARVAATVPDVAVLDVRLPDGSGIDVCRAIRSQNPTVQCLIFTAFDDDEATYAAVLAGASGYVLKDIRGQRLIESIRRAALGEILVTPAVAAHVVSRLGTDRAEPAATLSARERQVLELISRGLTNRQIGEQLELAEKTVKNYVSGLLGKLGMQRRTQAAVFGAGLHNHEPDGGDRIRAFGTGTLAE
ncbi:response regulator transcription factor [Cryobacterium algoritolerans]|uniref:Response regulator transcription factor n=1 Tax=Cryobacterium algoritolerans TaxID=1259184 RepID=A0A4R8WPX1_9MICO|nr:response regulator transcription factor [Cryobacterium algoritolerans]TFC12255.1 response regulator transcription factor [Cryobacterium algoritolerans]